MRVVNTRNILIHQKNPISFSFDRQSLNKENFKRFVVCREIEDENSPWKSSELSKDYIHFVHNSVYQFQKSYAYAYLSGKDIERFYHQFEQLYYFLMHNLRMNFVDVGDQSSCGKVTCVPKHVNFVASTLRPQDVLEINNSDYYQVSIRGLKHPLYFSLDTKLYDDNGNQKSLLDILYRTGKRKVLGLSSDHELKTFEIENVKNLNLEEEPLDILDVPFYEFSVFQENPKDKLSVLMNHIIVDLD